MSDLSPGPVVAPLKPLLIPNSQAVVAFTIVIGLVVIGMGAIVSAIVDHGLAALAYGAVGVVVGSLATALNAPTGIAGVIAEARKTPADGAVK